LLLGSFLVAMALAAPRACEGDCRCADTVSGPVCFVAHEVPWEEVAGRVGVLIGDLGRDGRADAVVVGCTENNTIVGDCGPRRVRSIAWSGGALVVGESQPLVALDPERLTLADVDGDRRADLVGCQGEQEGPVVFLAGDGKGSFAEPAELGGSCDVSLAPVVQPAKKGGRVLIPGGTTLARLDGGTPQVVAERSYVATTALAADATWVVAATMTGELTVYEARHDALSSVHTAATSVRPRAVHIADLDGDGRDDLLCATRAIPASLSCGAPPMGSGHRRACRCRRRRLTSRRGSTPRPWPMSTATVGPTPSPRQ